MRKDVRIILVAIRQRIVDYFNRVSLRQDIVDLGAPLLLKSSAKQHHFLVLWAESLRCAGGGWVDSTPRCTGGEWVHHVLTYGN